MAKNAKNAKNATVAIATDLTKEERKALAEEKKLAIATALNDLQIAMDSDIALTIGQAGELLAGLDSKLTEMAKAVKKTDENAPVWALNLTPIQIVINDVTHKWVEVAGLDRNAKVQIVDNKGKCEIIVTPLTSRSMEEKAYFDALVASGKDLTKAVALRKAVSGRKFNQLFAIAKAQEKERLEKKYSKFVPPIATVEEAVEVIA